ncbi:MAG: SMP-30/gluconolactonase/LRE family protein [Vicinamibacterales bacterium]|jgi:sugar lactone lactonase YvrE|nr:SMP-30/gluconolactonase/LRE family protein [Vicinamibacterales bacterium]MDP6608422.1 SMP-30/gluconolactonase/LRE family protein [Vicinamibacterales bacterium]|tara:strand:- start:4133 stop:5068 length:936 start_codon:yes stop_codon:yes gene_type:complete
MTCRGGRRRFLERGGVLVGIVGVALAMGAEARAQDAPLFVATPLTEANSFTSGIEGPACDVDGTVYAVNFARQGTIGRVTADGAAELFAELPEGSIGNGIRFGPDGQLFVADYPQHNVLTIDRATRVIRVHAHDATMNQPNDLSIVPDGTLYASDPNWAEGTGQLWRIGPDGEATRLAEGMGTTNGIDVSPDGRTLYVGESAQRRILAIDLTDAGLGDRRVIARFPDFSLDGLRVDIDGNLYVTRHGAGVVLKMTPEGRVLQEIEVLGERPSNICIGGPDGRTAVVTEMEHGRLVTFRIDRPGLAWSRLPR